MIRSVCKDCASPALDGHRYCQKHIAIKRAKVPNRRKYAKSTFKSDSSEYDEKWRKFQSRYLFDNPICVRCKINGKIRAAKDADHIFPLSMYPSLKFVKSNLQALCRSCHSIKGARYEVKGEYPDYKNRIIYTEPPMAIDEWRS